MKPQLIPALIASVFALAACDQAANNAPAPSAPAAASSNASAASQTSEAASAASSASEAASATAPKADGSMSTDIRKDNIGGDFTLTDGDGKPFALSSLKGKVVVLSFGYTHCPDICPTELLTYNDTLKQLGDEAKNVAVVFVSVDPDRDTPELMKQYVKQFNPAFIGLTDTQGGNEIALAKQQWRIISAKADIKSEKLYNVDHSSGTYLLDKQGNAAYFERFGAEAPQIAADIKKLLAE
ncbi:SCO family protein [uncultured Kingella sp.]|uniref:SCO family protein n=1 Tax=uncultured Kingella sp. TaxID=159270 RepID=UPI00259A5DD2|nr:SCO family protein [uncultured Kingella sp.]